MFNIPRYEDVIVAYISGNTQLSQRREVTTMASYLCVNKADNNSARKIVINCNYLFSQGFFFGVGRALIGIMCPEFTTIEILKGLF